MVTWGKGIQDREPVSTALAAIARLHFACGRIGQAKAER